MKKYTLSFNKEFNREGKGWYLSHKQNDTLFSTISCKLADKIVFLSNTKEVQEALDKENNSVQFRNLSVIPLFKKSLIRLNKKSNKHDSIAIYLETEEGKTISEINLKNSATCYFRKTKENNAVAMIIYALKEWNIELTQNDGKTITIDASTCKIQNSIKKNYKPKKNLIVKKTLYLPDNVLIARPDREKNTIATKEGFESVSIAVLLSKNTLVLNHKPKRIVLDKDLTEKDVADVKAFLQKKFKVITIEE